VKNDYDWAMGSVDEKIRREEGDCSHSGVGDWTGRGGEEEEGSPLERPNQEEPRDALLLNSGDALKNKVSALKGILANVDAWTPTNCCYGSSHNYNTKTHNTHKHDAVVEQALDDYKLFADKVNEKRRTPIRNITIRTRIDADGSRTLEASWTIHRDTYIHHYFIRNYQILPEFKFLNGTTVEGLEAEAKKEQDEKDAKKKALADKKAERARRTLCMS